MDLADACLAAVRRVCPADGVSIRDVANKSGWRIDFSPSATDQQRAAAFQALADFDALEAAKALLKARVDADAERARLRYITPGSGKAMEYLEKKDQALAVLAMGESAANALAAHGASEFPILSASVPVEAPSLFAAAQRVAATYDAWAVISGDIARVCIAAKKAIADAVDIDAAKAAFDALTRP